MSLVGSLEDLGLVDILQIVSLSRKSGMLMLRSESGDGRIVLCDGLVQGARIKGEVEDLRGLLIAQGCVDGDAFDRARTQANERGVDLDAALAEACGLDSDQLASLRREHVERAVMRMFGWRSGEFSFEIRDELPDDERDLLLPTGLNTQYLAMEATRLGDEAELGRGPEAGTGEAGDRDEDDDAFVFSGETDASPSPASATDALALATAEAVDPFAEDAPPGASVEEPEPVRRAVAEVAIDAVPAAETRVPVSVAASAPLRAPDAALVAIDANLSTLEWLKASVAGICARTHIFQRRDAALVRIRQYLARGTVPIVALADSPADRRGPDAEGFTSRIRSLAPTMPILVLRSESTTTSLPPDIDGVLMRPRSPSADPDRWHLDEPLAEQLRADLAPWLLGEGVVIARRRARGALARLKKASDRLRDPATQGEVLTLVLDFAAETFGRVAMFMLRDDEVIGMAQRAMPSAGGPDDDAIRSLSWASGRAPDLFREVLEQGAPVHRVPRESDRELVATLGDAIPIDFYAAPIESGGSVVALVYVDSLPEIQPLPDTTSLEIVLHEVGLVLDRAVLERALAERG